MKRKRAAIYCRVDCGGDLKARQETLTLQRQQLKRYAEKKGFQISGYYEDNGFPGHNLERPGLVHLIKDHSAGAFDLVLVVSRSRLYRGSRWDEPRWPFQVCSLNQLEHNWIR